jgi:hypothetical protein
MECGTPMSNGLKQIDRETPAGLDIHLIQDNYATHKHAKVKAWLARHPYMDERNAHPLPYTWKAEGAAVLAKIKRARAALDKANAA